MASGSSGSGRASRLKAFRTAKAQGTAASRRQAP